MVIISSSVKPVKETSAEVRFGNLVRTKKLALNPLFGEGSANFPDRYLGSACAQWAAESSLAFVKQFYSNMGLTPHFNLNTIQN